MLSGQLPLFEENYFFRTHTSVVGQPDIALTELVANCWDAGACLVEITIPLEEGGLLVVSDNGVGMTEEEFDKRWRTLAYNRLTHQGSGVEFPPGVNRQPRRAYGRNGVGRHAMFCFCNEFDVITTKNGKCVTFRVEESAGTNPFKIDKTSVSPSNSHGTILRGKIVRTLPRPADMLEILSARFMYDPEFVLRVNGETLELLDHTGLILHKNFTYSGDHQGEVYVLNSGDTARTKFQHGVAFWVGKRLVGTPSWNIGQNSMLDGRTKEAKRLTFIVNLDGIHDHVKEDWSGFRTSTLTQSLFEASEQAVNEILRELMAQRVEERTQEVIESKREQVRALTPLARLEVAEFAREVTEAQPFVTSEVLEAAVDALIKLEDSRSGQALIKKLSTMAPDDLEGLNRLLDDWTVRDALTVLDEIGRRIRIVEAIERLSVDPNVDELHTLHPLVTQARWLFGPEYDSPHYLSNVTLRTVLSKLVGKRISKDSIQNPQKRPDLVILMDATISATGIEDVTEEGLVSLDKILLLELKRGASTIGRTEMQQADEYVEEIINSQEIDGTPRVNAFVIGHKVDHVRSSQRRIGERGVVTACTYGQLVRTANKRLFSLRDRVEVCYPNGADSDLVKAISKSVGLFDLPPSD